MENASSVVCGHSYIYNSSKYSFLITLITWPDILMNSHYYYYYYYHY